MATQPVPIKKKKIVLPESALSERAYAWHAHDSREVLKVLGSAVDGLAQKEVDIRVGEYGTNTFTPQKSTPFIAKLMRELRGPLSIVLLGAFAVTVFLEEYIDAGVILVALCIAVAVSLFQEGKASRAFATLASSQALAATVFRDGARHEVDSSQLVPGDIVELQGGMQVPADMRLLRVKQLSINEAPLTGEWVAVKKTHESLSIGLPLPDQVNMAFGGTFVASGSGLGVVVATGDHTVVGDLANDLRDIEGEQTPLQHEMAQFSLVILYIISGLIVVIFSIGLFVGQGVHDMALIAVAVAVAAIPEGLPAAVTIVLAVGMEALLKRGGLVRNLLAAETLGSTTYILTDKTGTLTEAKMSVTGVLTRKALNLDPDSWKQSEEITQLLDVALCATDAYTDKTEEGVVLRGESMERAILKAGLDIGIPLRGESSRGERVDYLPFTSEQMFAAGLAPYESGAYQMCINGAPELLLAAAAHVWHEGEVEEMTAAHKEALEEQIDVLTKEGKRLVAVAYASQAEGEVHISTQKDLLALDVVFLGVLVCSDPVRKGVKEAIEGVHKAGAQVVLVTGDNPETALAVARAVGIATIHDSALTGTDITELSDSELLDVLEHVRVFARVLPRQKMRIAEILQRSGEIVAMTGDGINDAPALQKANIGIAIGSGTQVAQEASDLVLVEDSFATIYAAIEEGRRIIANLRKIIGYLLSTSLSEVALIGAALITGAASPILPVQILWANIIEEGLMSVAFAFEKGEKGAMKRRPQDIHEEGLLSKDMIGFLALVVLILSTITVLLYFYLRSIGLDIDELRSAMFISVAMDSLFIAFAFRSLSVPIWRISLFENRFFLGSFFISIVLLFGALSIPFMRDVLSYVPLPGSLIALVIAASFFGLIAVEFAKWVFFERRR